MNFEQITLIRAFVMLGLPPIALLLSCYVICAVPFAVFGVRVKRRTRLRRMAKHCAAVVISTIAAWLIADYLWLAQLRPTAHGCHSDVSDNGEYVATRCLLNAGQDYLRLYESRTGRLIADRTYSCDPADPKLIVLDHIVFDGCAHDDSAIKLPPSLLDRLRAKLP